MEVLYKKSKQGSAKYNEDRYGHTDSIAWVIDGATNIFQTEIFGDNDTEYITDLMNHSISKVVEQNKDHSLKDIMAKSCSLVEKRIMQEAPEYNELPEYARVSFSITLVKSIDSKIDYFKLGDCILNPYDCGKIQDPRLERCQCGDYEKILQNYSQRLPIFQETRKLLNAKNGYPVGTIDGKGINNAFVGNFEPIKPFALYTDGFEDLLIKYKMSICDIVDDHSLIDEVFHLEERQGFTEKNKVYGKKDDATILILNK